MTLYKIRNVIFLKFNFFTKLTFCHNFFFNKSTLKKIIYSETLLNTLLNGNINNVTVYGIRKLIFVRSHCLSQVCELGDATWQSIILLLATSKSYLLAVLLNAFTGMSWNVQALSQVSWLASIKAAPSELSAPVAHWSLPLLLLLLYCTRHLLYLHLL